MFFSFLLYFLLFLFSTLFLLPTLVIILLLFTKVGREIGLRRILNMLRAKFQDTYDSCYKDFQSGSFNFDFSDFNNYKNDRPTGQMSRMECYRLFNLPNGANKKDIDKAYKILMKKHHPDKGGSVHMTKKINEARDILLGKRI